MATVQNLFDARKAGNKDPEANARERLKVWGIDDKQVDEIVKAGKPITHLTIRSPITGHVLKKHVREGEYVEEGSPLFEVADLSTVWVEARVGDRSDLAVIKRGRPVRVTAQALPDRRFDGEVSPAHPHRDPDTRELRVRFTVTNPREELRPGMHVAVVLGAATAADTADLMKTKVATAKVTFEVTVRAVSEGKADAEKVYLWSRRWMEARRDGSDKPADRAAAAEAHRDRMKELRKTAESQYNTGKTTPADVLAADFYVAEAELWLAQAK